MSINFILEEIKSEPRSIIPILSTLNNDKHILSSISKSNLQHLTSRVNNLIKSPNQYNKWCGINIVKIIIKDYNILAAYGSILLVNLLSVLENCNQTINRKILSNCIEVINDLMDQIRGKPTLTREILTPKLASIITFYLQFLQYEPNLILTSLKTLIKHHPTTFRPFGNKLQNKLISIMNDENFINYPVQLRVEICNVLAILPVIEKTEPESKWNSNLKIIIGEIIEIVNIYQEFLNFRDDQDLMNLIKKVPKQDTRILNDLSIDFNKSNTIFQISSSLSILINSLASHITTETSYTISVPIGLIVTVCEIICTVNLKYLSFKSDVRDEDIRNIIKLTLIENYTNVLTLLDKLLLFQGHLLPHFDKILSFLEILVPSKNNKLDAKEIIGLESLNVKLLSTVGKYLQLIGVNHDNSMILKFVDVALVLIEPRIKIEQSQKPQTLQKAKKKKNVFAAPLSDILSHEHLFKQSIPKSTVSTVRFFINQIIVKFELPPTQHYRIMRYLIIESIHSSYYNLQHNISPELKDLLISAVLYPGYEKTNILPIVSTILRDDKLLSVFNNPRFPPLPKYINMSASEIPEDEDEEMEEETVVSKEAPLKRRKLQVEATPIEVEDESEVVNDIDKDQIFSTNVHIETTEVINLPTEVIDSPTIVRTTEVEQQYPENNTVTTTETITEEVEDSGSDFEMPEINVDSDDEE